MPDDVWSRAVDDLPLDRSNRMMRRGETEITLAARPGMKLYACGFDGARKFEVPTAACGEPGKIRFIARNVTEQGAIAVYELVKE